MLPANDGPLQVTMGKLRKWIRFLVKIKLIFPFALVCCTVLCCVVVVQSIEIKRRLSDFVQIDSISHQSALNESIKIIIFLSPTNHCGLHVSIMLASIRKFNYFSPVRHTSLSSSSFNLMKIKVKAKSREMMNGSRRRGSENVQYFYDPPFTFSLRLAYILFIWKTAHKMQPPSSHSEHMHAMQFSFSFKKWSKTFHHVSELHFCNMSSLFAEIYIFIRQHQSEIFNIMVECVRAGRSRWEQHSNICNASNLHIGDGSAKRTSCFFTTFAESHSRSTFIRFNFLKSAFYKL